jgi:hypothetical protein
MWCRWGMSHRNSAWRDRGYWRKNVTKAYPRSMVWRSRTNWTGSGYRPTDGLLKGWRWKDKVHPKTGYEGAEKKYTSTLSLTSALDGGGVGGPRHIPAVWPLGKTRYQLNRKLGGPQGRSGRVRKTSHPPRFDPRTVHTVTVAVPTTLPDANETPISMWKGIKK